MDPEVEFREAGFEGLCDSVSTQAYPYPEPVPPDIVPVAVKDWPESIVMDRGDVISTFKDGIPGLTVIST
jgi:hypothetical protein